MSDDDLDDFILTPPVEREVSPATTRQRDDAARHRAKTLDVMHRRYGVATEGVVCGSCAFLVRSGGGAGDFPKCKAFRVSCSEATDWRLRWRACGKYRERTAPV